MKIVLEERGVDTHGMNAEKMRENSTRMKTLKLKKLYQKSMLNKGVIYVYTILSIIVNSVPLREFGPAIPKSTQELMQMGQSQDCEKL